MISNVLLGILQSFTSSFVVLYADYHNEMGMYVRTYMLEYF